MFRLPEVVSQNHQNVFKFQWEYWGRGPAKPGLWPEQELAVRRSRTELAENRSRTELVECRLRTDLAEHGPRTELAEHRSRMELVECRLRTDLAEHGQRTELAERRSLGQSACFLFDHAAVDPAPHYNLCSWSHCLLCWKYSHTPWFLSLWKLMLDNIWFYSGVVQKFPTIISYFNIAIFHCKAAHTRNDLSSNLTSNSVSNHR